MSNFILSFGPRGSLAAAGVRRHQRQGHRQRHGLRVLRARHREAPPRMDATKAVFVDLKSKVVLVEAKEGKTLDEKTITAEIADSGYDVVKLEPSSSPWPSSRPPPRAKK